MIIDAHTHIFPETIRNQRERFLDNEPAFELLYASPKSKMVGADELVAAMDAHGVDKAVTFGFPWCTADIFKRHNDYILESVQRYPDRLIGLCCMDAEQPEAAREVERCLGRRSFRRGRTGFLLLRYGVPSPRRHGCHYGPGPPVRLPRDDSHQRGRLDTSTRVKPATRWPRSMLWSRSMRRRV